MPEGLRARVFEHLGELVVGRLERGDPGVGVRRRHGAVRQGAEVGLVLRIADARLRDSLQECHDVGRGLGAWDGRCGGARVGEGRPGFAGVGFGIFRWCVAAVVVVVVRFPPGWVGAFRVPPLVKWRVRGVGPPVALRKSAYTASGRRGRWLGKSFGLRLGGGASACNVRRGVSLVRAVDRRAPGASSTARVWTDGQLREADVRERLLGAVREQGRNGGPEVAGGGEISRPGRSSQAESGGTCTDCRKVANRTPPRHLAGDSGRGAHMATPAVGR